MGVLFFFFKQKTAYEMRISDWSSDVCSSDLGEGMPLTPGALQQIDDILKKADVSTFMKRQPVTLCFGNQPPKPIFHEIFVGVNELRQAIAPNVNLRGARSLFHHLTRTLDTRVFRSLLDGRSEEHTSELQSLMRISYAVFCLKKKHNMEYKQT